MAKFLIPLALFFVAVAFLYKGLYLDPHEVPSPLVGKPAPAFKAPILSDAEKSFSTADMKGKVWLLNVWASWCVACREEHPVLMEMAKEGSVDTYGLDYKDTDQEAQAVIDSNGNPYKKIATDVDGKIGIDYGVYGVPETYVIDKAGIIRYKQIGPITEEAFFTKILPMVKELQKVKS
jgi:cytochrome c biogenesis protein CcmG, thiol:disulfide interchange protein DsbE